jgi:tetratricopeptide (TPR) repeat protein
VQQINQAIQAGYAAFQRGAFDEARRHLRQVNHAKAVHLLALVEKGAGELQEAAILFERAAKMDPQDPEIANNRATLARNTDQHDLAEAEYRRALSLKPEFPQAKTGLGRLYIDTERWTDALDLYETLLRSDPDNVGARYGLGTALLGDGQAEAAESLFDALLNEGNNDPKIYFMRARARLELGQVEEGIEDLRIAHAAQPTDFTLRTLAQICWMKGDTGAFDALLTESALLPELVVTSAEILRQSGKPRAALDALENIRRTAALPVESWAVAANAHIDLNEPTAAAAEAMDCLASYPDNRLAKGNLITALLMQGKADEAMPYIQTMRKAEPNNQHWIAYEATALRLMGSERYGHIVDLERFVRPYRLPVPEGFDSLDEFNAAFLKALEPWHQFETHPLDQSLRDGSQTPRDLTTIDDPVIKAFYKALDIPIRQYMADVGSGDDHPLTARNTGNYRIAGAWSVKLKGGGWHVNHVHPEGWISSAYYVSVPEETASDENRAGWIKFAEPPFETTPPTPPEKWIAPTAGTLVLFPSFLWHGTEAIHDGSVRVTAPFDAVPV